MPRIFVDDEPFDDRSVVARTVADALRCVQEGFSDPRRMVVGLRCDEREVSGEALTALLERPFSSVKRLDVLTGSRGRLVSEAMTRAAELLEDCLRQCRQAGELVVEGRNAEGLRVLGECTKTWQQVHAAVEQSLPMLGLNAESVTVHDTSLTELMNQPKEVLTQIKQALVARDHVLLADILQYEFAEATQAWHAVLARIRQAGEDLDDA